MTLSVIENNTVAGGYDGYFRHGHGSAAASASAAASSGIVLPTAILAFTRKPPFGAVALDNFVTQQS